MLRGDTVGAAPASAERLASDLPESLTTVLDLIRHRAPNARIALFGYPKIFESDTLCVSISRVNQAWLNTFADELNATIREVAEAANEPGKPPVIFVDPQSRFTATTSAPATRPSTGSSSPSPLPRTRSSPTTGPW